MTATPKSSDFVEFTGAPEILGGKTFLVNWINKRQISLTNVQGRSETYTFTVKRAAELGMHVTRSSDTAH